MYLCTYIKQFFKIVCLIVCHWRNTSDFRDSWLFKWCYKPMSYCFVIVLISIPILSPILMNVRITSCLDWSGIWSEQHLSDGAKPCLVMSLSSIAQVRRSCESRARIAAFSTKYGAEIRPKRWYNSHTAALKCFLSRQYRTAEFVNSKLKHLVLYLIGCCFFFKIWEASQSQFAYLCTTLWRFFV